MYEGLLILQTSIETMEQGKEPGKDFKAGTKALNNYAKYTSVAFQMMAIIGACAFIGYKIDEWYAHEVKWVTALACVIGVCLSIYQVVRQLKD